MSTAVSVFVGCAQSHPDPWWKNIFTDAAKGILPSWFTLRAGCLNYKRGNRKGEVAIPTDISKAIQVLTDFFRCWGGIYSPNDGLQVYQQPEMTWDVVRRKPHLFAGAVYDYSRTLCDHLGLSSVIKQHLMALLIYGMRSGFIQTVHYDHDAITYIPQLIYREDMRSFAIQDVSCQKLYPHQGTPKVPVQVSPADKRWASVGKALAKTFAKRQ